jgi:hypothetical protein
MVYDTPQWIKDDLKKSRRKKALSRIANNEFVQNLKRTAEENPVVVILAVAAVVTASAKLIKAHGAAKGSRAYAKQVDYRIKRGR